MDRFLNRPWRDEDVVRIVGELRQRLDQLFTFVRIPGVSWNSNEAEREVRIAVVIRKMNGGRRTARGTWVLERFLTVWRTCWKRELRSWDLVLEKLGAPQAPGPPSAGPASCALTVLPYLDIGDWHQRCWVPDSLEGTWPSGHEPPSSTGVFRLRETPGDKRSGIPRRVQVPVQDEAALPARVGPVGPTSGRVWVLRSVASPRPSCPSGR